jgi:hypothetical protein
VAQISRLAPRPSAGQTRNRPKQTLPAGPERAETVGPWRGRNPTAPDPIRAAAITSMGERQQGWRYRTHRLAQKMGTRRRRRRNCSSWSPGSRTWRRTPFGLTGMHRRRRRWRRPTDRKPHRRRNCLCRFSGSRNCLCTQLRPTGMCNSRRRKSRRPEADFPFFDRRTGNERCPGCILPGRAFCLRPSCAYLATGNQTARQTRLVFIVGAASLSHEHRSNGENA